MKRERATPRPAERALLAVLAAAMLGALFARYLPARGEDFAYYYCAGAAAAKGLSPYDPAPYQACVAEVLGGPNLNVSRLSGSAYPPAAMLPFRLLAALPYGSAYAWWNLLLLAASVVLLKRRGLAPRDWPVLLAWPGFILCWTYHKSTLPLFAVMLGGMGLAARGKELRGGALLGLLAFQPQWLGAAGLYLAARRRRRALGALSASALALFAAGALLAPLGPWLSSAASHSNSIIGLDNQSLFIALYKPLSGLIGPVHLDRFQAARYAVSLLLAALAWRVARAKEDLPAFLGLILLAQPYSHGSDALWAFPLFHASAARLAESRGLSARAAGAAVLLSELGLILFLGGFVPGRLHSGPWEDRQGYLACAVAVLWLLSRARTEKEQTNG